MISGHFFFFLLRFLTKKENHNFILTIKNKIVIENRIVQITSLNIHNIYDFEKIKKS